MLRAIEWASCPFSVICNVTPAAWQCPCKTQLSPTFRFHPLCLSACLPIVMSALSFILCISVKEHFHLQKEESCFGSFWSFFLFSSHDFFFFNPDCQISWKPSWAFLEVCISFQINLGMIASCIISTLPTLEHGTSLPWLESSLSVHIC